MKTESYVPHPEQCKHCHTILIMKNEAPVKMEPRWPVTLDGREDWDYNDWARRDPKGLGAMNSQSHPLHDHWQLMFFNWFGKIPYAGSGRGTGRPKGSLNRKTAKSNSWKPKKKYSDKAFFIWTKES